MTNPDISDKIGLAARKIASETAPEYVKADLVDQMVLLHEIIRELRYISQLLEAKLNDRP